MPKNLLILCVANAQPFSQISELIAIGLQFEVEVHTSMLLRQVAMTVTVAFVFTRVRTMMTWEPRAAGETKSKGRGIGSAVNR